MDPSPRFRVFVTIAFATFHTLAFLAILLLATNVSSDLRGVIGLTHPLVGIALCIALWATTWFATKQGLKHSKWNLIQAPRYRDLMGEGIIWGGINGALFLLFAEIIIGAGIVTSNIRVVQASLDLLQSLIVVGDILIIFIFGAPLAFMIGANVGFLVGILDSLLIAAFRRLEHI